MERKSLIVGIVLIVVGFAARLVPQVVTGLSFWSIAQVVGIVLFVRALWMRRAVIRSWVKGAPVGKQVALVAVLVFLLLCVNLVAGAVREVKTGRHYDRVAEDLEKDDPLAAISLARHYSGEESAPLRKRIVTRMGELGNSSPRVTGTLREAVRIDPSPSVRSAAAESLSRLMTPQDVLNAIVELPHLDPQTRAIFSEILSRHTGKDFGEDAKRWIEWFVSCWAGEEGDGAYRLALAAWRSSPEWPAIREVCIRRLKDPEGVKDATLDSALSHESPRVRAAAATAIGRTGGSKWPSVLEDALKSEADSVTGVAMAAALLDLAPEGAAMALIRTARTASHEAGRNAALTALVARYPTGGSTDVADVIFAVRKTLPAGAKRREALDMLVKMARKSEAARRRLNDILGDESEGARDRGRALSGILAADGEALANEDLVSLLVDPPSVDFAEKVRGELKRRTGKDGGRDAEAWKKIIEALD